MDEQLTGKDYMVSDKLTLPDITLPVFLYRLITIRLAISLPAQVQAWSERLEQLPAYQKWVMSDFSGLKGQWGTDSKNNNISRPENFNFTRSVIIFQPPIPYV